MTQVKRERRSVKARAFFILLCGALGLASSVVASHYVHPDKKACQRANAEQIMNHPQDTLAKNPC
jgi:hypothetical protein